jgi:DNA-binding CsgD family transcriptional regulator/tetratricopeptide (TPR) repeat protein
VLHPGGTVALDPNGALLATGDPRARRIAAGEKPDDGRPFVIVVDDAQELDETSATALARAVYSRHAAALLAVTVTRDGLTADSAEPAAARMAIELWLRGVADRIDLAELSPEEADQLVQLFGGADFDTLTRATVVGLADGSRMLLREIATEATTAIRQGRDPLQAIRETPTHGRLADVLSAHLAQFPPEHRKTLAVLARLPRIALADAARIVPRDTIEELVAARLVYDDGTPERRLTANSALGRAAARSDRQETIPETLGRAMRRMIDESEDWWSAPLARRIADGWHRGDLSVPACADVRDDLRVRISEDAARLANDAGEPDLAATYARRGMNVRDSIELQLELTYANMTRGESVDLAAFAGMIERSEAEHGALLRWLQVRASLPYGRPDLDRSALPILVSVQEPATPDFELARAQIAALMLDCPTAARVAEALVARPGVSTVVRMRAAVATSIAYSCLGRTAEAQQWFIKVQRLSGDREASTALTTVDRLWGISTEILHHGLSGTDPRPVIERLERECNAAALEGEESTVAMAGLVVALAYATIGDADRALTELKAALRRMRTPMFASWAATVSIVVARALALSDRGEDARATLDLADPSLVDGVPLLAHARLLAESCVNAALGLRDEAVAAVREAMPLAEGTPLLLARDLFQLIALGDEDDLLVAKMSRLADGTAAPAVRLLNERAHEIVADRAIDEGPAVQDAVRLGAVWAGGEGQRDWARRINVGGAGAPRPGSHVRGESVHNLTRREREIALLVADGLSNREIATRLFLSVRTVESHIYQARTKVGAHTRGDLGRLVAQQTRAAVRGRRIGY